MLNFTFSWESISQMCTELFLFLSPWHTNNPPLKSASWCVTIHRQQLTLPQNDNSQQAYSPATANSLCVYLCDLSGQRGQVWPSVAECPPQQMRKDRTSHFLQTPLVKLPIFTPGAWNCSVSLYERHPDGTVGSKLSKPIEGSQGWGSSREACANKLNAGPQSCSW